VAWELVTSGDALGELTARAAAAGAVAVDTEFMRRNTFYPQVALVQLCFGEGADGDTAWLVDPLAIGDPAPLARLLADTSVTKVLHSASEDLEVFQHWLGVLPAPLFDTQRAAALLDQGFGLGYRALVEQMSGIDLPKGETRSDWLQRPLTESQCEYAAQDVTCLLPIYRALDGQCREQCRLDWVLDDGADAVAAANGVEPYHPRVKGAWKLAPRQLGALVAICAWREDTARVRDKPRSWIIDDRTCLQLAVEDPRDERELRSRVELPRPVLRRHGEELLELLSVQREVDADALPGPLPKPLAAPQRDALKKLKARGRAIARELGVAPEVLLPGKDYELLLREGAGEPVQEPRHWRGWRGERVVAPLRQSLAGGGK